MAYCSKIPKDRKCIKCGSAKTWMRNLGSRLQPHWHRSGSDFLCSICYDRLRNKSPKRKISDKSRRDRIRKKLLTYIGRGQIKCIHCGCDKQELLEINHINGGGTKENAHPAKFYYGILRGERRIEDLELRCKICNALHYLEMQYGRTEYMIRWDNLS